jgi:hypothetical protein
MAKRQPKPFFKKSHRAWYLNLNGKQIRLASEEEGHDKAMEVYYSVMAGRLPIDNNETEQLMKQIAIGRKNWLFLGSVAAGERMADLMTLVSSALRNDLDAWAYVKDVLDQLLAGSTDHASPTAGVQPPSLRF